MFSGKPGSRRVLLRLVAGLFALSLLAAPSTARGADEDPVALFREGMSAYRAGRWEEATTKLESALAVDPDLHSARLPLAECYYKIGIIPGAINHLKVYITELEPGEEQDRARRQLQKYQSDMAEMVGLIESVDISEVDLTEEAPDGYEFGRDEGKGDRGVDGGGRPLLLVDAQFGVSHFGTSFQPTLGDLAIGVRLYPARFLAVGLSAHLGLGGAEAIEGLLTLPQLHLVVGPVILTRPALLMLGADAFLIGSRVEERDVVDPGIAFTAELRGPLGDSPLYVGGGLAVGYAVGPYVAGHAVIGICLARAAGAR